LTAAMSNAERQKRFREKAMESNLIRLQIMIEPHVADDLKKVCEENGWTQRQAVEKAIIELAGKGQTVEQCRQVAQDMEVRTP